jgi:hypothetical protein
MLKINLAKKKKDYKDKESLKEAIKIEWENLNKDKQLFKNLVKSMPNRLNAVIKSNGYATKY